MNEIKSRPVKHQDNGLTRRDFLKRSFGLVAAGVAARYLSGCTQTTEPYDYKFLFSKTLGGKGEDTVQALGCTFKLIDVLSYTSRDNRPAAVFNMIDSPKGYSLWTDNLTYVGNDPIWFVNDEGQVMAPVVGGAPENQVRPILKIRCTNIVIEGDYYGQRKATFEFTQVDEKT